MVQVSTGPMVRPSSERLAAWFSLGVGLGSGEGSGEGGALGGLGTTDELAVVQLSDNHTLSAVIRIDGDCGCDETQYDGDCGVYRPYYQTFSSDLGSK